MLWRMSLEVTPLITEKIAYNFCGLCLNGLDLLTSQKRALLCKPKREKVRPYSYTDPAQFLGNIKRLFPTVKEKKINQTFPQAAILRRKELMDLLGTSPEFRWFDFGILARHHISPHQGEMNLSRVYHAYFLIASNTETDMDIIEIIDDVSDNHHLLVNDDQKPADLFSGAVVYYLVTEEIIPRLLSNYNEANSVEGAITTFGVFTTAVQDYDIRSQIVTLPPL